MVALGRGAKFVKDPKSSYLRPSDSTQGIVVQAFFSVVSWLDMSLEQYNEKSIKHPISLRRLMRQKLAGEEEIEIKTENEKTLRDKLEH